MNTSKRSREEENVASTERRCQYCCLRGISDDGEEILLPWKLGGNYFHLPCMEKYSESRNIVENRVYELVCHGKHIRNKGKGDEGAGTRAGEGAGSIDRMSMAKEVFEQLDKHYNENTRYYHTLTHIADLLKLSASANPQKTKATDTIDKSESADCGLEGVVISDTEVVDWAILYHDIIYDPKSSTNEEDSAEYFKAWVTKSRENDQYMWHLSEECANKVYDYIIATKLHETGDSTDTDLQIFIDFDMSIIGCEDINRYDEYTRKIRLEYSHVSDSDWVSDTTGRVAFLKKTLKISSHTTLSKDDERIGTKKARIQAKRSSSSRVTREGNANKVVTASAPLEDSTDTHVEGKVDSDTSTKPIFSVPALREKWQTNAERNMKTELAWLTSLASGLT